MINKNDPLYGAMLVESAKLHLGTVMAGQASEIFFSDMLKIVEARVHFGYKTIRGKDVKLRGIKDFIHNVHYGLGVKDMPTFLCAAVSSAIKEKSQKKYGYQFIDWLKAEDPVFNFPPEFFEYRRLIRMIKYRRNLKPRKKTWLCSIVKFIYTQHPHLLGQIGPGQKYSTIEECYFSEGFSEKIQTLKPIKLFSNPTSEQLEKVAEILFERMGSGKTRLLAFFLIRQCKNAASTAIGNGGSVSDVDAEPAGANW